MFYAAITPLLPELADELDLGKNGAGVLAGSYAAGTLIGALPAAGWRRAPASRRRCSPGLSLMSVSGLAFAFGVVDRRARRRALHAGRRRGVLVGGRHGLGGRRGAARAPRRGHRRRPGRGHLRRPARPGGRRAGHGDRARGGVLDDRALRRGAGRLGAHDARARRLGGPHGAEGGAAPALDAGRHVAHRAAGGRLRRASTCSRRCASTPSGATGLALGATFFAAAGVEAIIAPAAGRAADRRGAVPVARVGLAIGVVALVVLQLPGSAWSLAIVVVFGAGLLGVLWVPGRAAADRRRRAHRPRRRLRLRLLQPGVGGRLHGRRGGRRRPGAGQQRRRALLLLAARTRCRWRWSAVRDRRRPLAA